MYQYTLCAFLAPALVSAMAFPWALPEPTLVVPEGDNWSPAPTQAPGFQEFGGMELFRRAASDNTCGYISGISTSSLTCNDDSYVCATNSAYGVHGCCDPNGLSTCSIPTTCIPSSLMSASCTDAACTNNQYIAKCTDSTAPYCYQWRYVYSTKTVMTEFGCNSEAFTISVQRTFDGENSAAATSSQAVIPISYVTVTASQVTSVSSASSGLNNAMPASGTTGGQGTGSPSASVQPQQGKSKSHVGAIVGGVIGGLVVIGALIFGAIFFILRSRKNKKNAAAQQAGTPGVGPAPGVAEYKPQPGGGFPPQQQQQYPPAQGGYYQQDVKPYQQQQMGVPGQEVGGQSNPYSPPTSPAPQYNAPFNAAPPSGIAEAGGSPVQNPSAQQPVGQSPHQPQHQIYEAPA